MTEIIWQDPPKQKISSRPSDTYRGKWQKLAGDLKQHPGRWALVATNASPGIVMHLKMAGLDVQTRTAGLGYRSTYCDIYARYQN